MFREFACGADEMGARRPRAVLLENVPSFATSHGGKDLEAALGKLNDLGYFCDPLGLIHVCAFVPQSRPWLFIIGSSDLRGERLPDKNDLLRPRIIRDFISRVDHLQYRLAGLAAPEHHATHTLAEVVERGTGQREGMVGRRPARTVSQLTKPLATRASRRAPNW